MAAQGHLNHSGEGMRGRHTVWAGILAVLVVVVGCSIWVLFFRDAPGTKIRNVVLISIDTCRADHLSCYGYERKTTPHIDAVAGEGVLFTRAHSTNPITLPAHSSMLTGTNPSYHGVHGNRNYRLSDANVSLAEIMRDHGYQTAAFVSAFVLDARFGLDQGFETYDDHVSADPGRLFISERSGGDTSRQAIKWLDNRGREPFFLFLHYFDPHAKHDPPEPFTSRFLDAPYAGEIAYTDHCIGQIIEKLKSLGIYDSTLLVSTSDHGESIGEHEEDTHGYFIYQVRFAYPSSSRRRIVPHRGNWMGRSASWTWSPQCWAYRESPRRRSLTGRIFLVFCLKRANPRIAMSIANRSGPRSTAATGCSAWSTTAGNTSGPHVPSCTI